MFQCCFLQMWMSARWCLRSAVIRRVTVWTRTAATPASVKTDSKRPTTEHASVSRTQHTKVPFTPNGNVTAAMMLVILIENNGVAQNGVVTHFRMTSLFSVRTVLLASSQSCRSIDTDAWCKWALMDIIHPGNTSKNSWKNDVAKF